jgi:DNA-binding GntR family transcriptional regulator
MERSGNNRIALESDLARRILAWLREEKLPRGSHLTAQSLADRFGVSRSPVTRALALLEDRGAVAHLPRHGYSVASPGRASAPPAATEPVAKAYLLLIEDRLAGRVAGQVSEAALQDAYGLTRLETKRLLARVASEGWAEACPGYGWRFTDVLTTPEGLRQTLRMRIALEPAALLEPGFRLPADVARRCRAVEEALLAAGAENAREDLIWAHAGFHEALMAACGNPLFVQALGNANRLRRLITYRTFRVDRARYNARAQEHLAILALVEQGRLRSASAMLRRHLRATLASVDRVAALLDGEKAR